MGTKIRVFIASTMKDLKNERRHVVARVRQLNFEPVNAEDWTPTGSRPWERIEKEMGSCHLFVLILGESYGWIPQKGPGADGGLSVTHMETRMARELGLPILPFLKRLDEGVAEDPQRRGFREEVSDWAAGGVIKRFEFDDELADGVAASLVEVLSDTYLSNAVQERSKSVRVLEPEPEVGRSGPEIVDIPRELTELVAAKKMVLLAGAGISMAAGYPSARAMTETVQAHLRRELNSPTLNLTGMPFQEIASNIEAAFGRGYLLDIFLRAMSGPQGIEPTEAHLASVRLFDRIVTTNFDGLFEEACRRQGIPHAVIEDYAGDGVTPDGVTIFKLSGSLERPETLLITERDVWDTYGDEPSGWKRLIGTVTRSPVLIVGSSLRDTAIKKLFSDAEGAIRGYIVSPEINPFERHQYQRLNLQPIDEKADDFFRQLSVAAGTPRPEGLHES
ncbi:MAG TPA: DUF4062 domain-containing protein [Pyrinomonadaceae bacterium]